MSSTKRGSVREVSDYYVTPVLSVTEYIDAIRKIEPGAFDGRILDPCAGGSADAEMSYPLALRKLGIPNVAITTIDIRPDSKAQIIADYLTYAGPPPPLYNHIISNPPFVLALEFIEKALGEVKEGGLVTMLLRLNFFGSKKRKKFWDTNMAKYCFVHSRRMNFRGGKRKTDSVEYMHCVWQRGYNPDHAELRII